MSTFFSKNYVLQVFDVSQKILLDSANIEKRLMSLINATVSHEMRNPINAIRFQVNEMDAISKQFDI